MWPARTILYASFNNDSTLNQLSLQSWKCFANASKHWIRQHRIWSGLSYLLPSTLRVANRTLFSAVPALLPTLIWSSYQVASCRSYRTWLLVRESRFTMVHFVVSTGRYSNVKESIGQPPLFHPIRLSSTREELILVKSSWSLANCGSDKQMRCNVILSLVKAHAK